MSARMPVIGVTASIEPITHGLWTDDPSVYLSRLYVDKVVAAGGMPVVLAPVVQDQQAAALLERLDALIVAGGADVDPGTYGEAAHPTVDATEPSRDRTEIALIRAAVDRDLPLLGICRGIQSMAVAAGGSLLQHVPDEVGSEIHSPTPGRMGSHPVRLAPGSRLHQILGDTLDVPTHHHQAVRTHPGYVVVARTADGIIEAMEAPEARWRFGVQWHPEASNDPRIFEALVAAAGE